MTPSIDRALHQFLTILLISTLLPIWFLFPLCRGHSWRVWLVKPETLTSPGHLVSPLVCRGPWMSTVVLYCRCHSDSASVLLYFTFYLIARGVHRTFATVAACQQRTPYPRTPSPDPPMDLQVFYVETNLSWTCIVSGLLSFERPSVLLFLIVKPNQNICTTLLRKMTVCPIWDLHFFYVETVLSWPWHIFGLWISTIHRYFYFAVFPLIL